MSVFDALIGQEKVVGQLRHALSEPGAMTHAWLFTGPPGSGRSVAALAFAAALQCDQGGCGTCQQCRSALAGSHPDVTRITTEKVIISMEEVRDLVGVAQRAPAHGRWRVIVMEDADRMVERTSNVLLKSIEEPPERTVWLLCAPSPDDVITTIRSRCRHVGLRIPPLEDVVRLLVEEDGIDEATARAAAQAAQCHVGMARRLVRNPQARQWRERVVRLPLQVRSVADAVRDANALVEAARENAQQANEERNQQEREKLLRDLGVEDGGTRLPPSVRARVRQLEEDQKRRATRYERDMLDRILVDLLSLYRDVAIAQVGGDTPFINADVEREIRQLALDSTLAATVARMDAIAVARRRLAGNVAPLLAMEAMLIALRPQAG